MVARVHLDRPVRRERVSCIEGEKGKLLVEYTGKCGRSGEESGSSEKRGVYRSSDER